VNPHVEQLRDEIHSAWRFRWLACGVALVLALSGWTIVFTMPDRYGASAQVLVDTRTALRPALQGLAVEQDVGVQLNYVRQSLTAEPQLRKIAEQTGVLSASIRDPLQQEQLLARLKEHIQLNVQVGDSDANGAGSITYGILYQDTDRARALRVVTLLLRTFVNETLGGKREGSENAQQFLESQVQDYERRLRTAEDRLAAFKASHLGLMPTEQGGYFEQLQKENTAVDDLKTKVVTLETRRSTLEKQLHGDAAISAATAAPGAGLPGAGGRVDTVTRIAETQAHLDELLLKYTDKHPDVVATRETLAELKARRAAEIENLRNGDANAAATSGASANPVFQSIQLALNQVDVDIADMHAQLAEHQTKAQELRKLLNTAPQVEAEYAQLSRDYDVNKAQYTALLSNYEKARLGERADNAGSVRFEVVQPPTVTFQPVSPPRSRLLAGLLLAALGMGGALAYGLAQLHPLVGSASAVAQLTGLVVLGVVGPAFPRATARIRRRQIWLVSFVMALLFASCAAAVIFSRAGMRLNIPALRHLVHL